MVKHLVIAGGGPRCVAFLGAIQTLHKREFFKQIDQFWGNSAGAIVATMLAMKVPVDRLGTIFEHIDFTKFRDIELTNIVSFSQFWGLDSGEAFMKSIRQVLEEAEPGSSEYTLQEVQGLHIVCSDLTTTSPLILDSKTFPTMKLVDALRASTSIPFFYRPFRNPIDGHLLVDGAVCSNFPWILLPSDSDRDDAIGFNFKIMDYSKEPRSLSEFIPKILNFRDVYWRSDKHKPTGPNIIQFDIRGFPAWHLALTKEDRDELITIGRITAEKWYEREGEKYITSRLSSGKPSCPPQNDRPCTQQQGNQWDRRGGSSDSHGCQLPQESARDSSRHLPSLRQPASRRWSV
jgi:predicted acylesterase/phospholipase RssA